jgi:hypothetical protein
MRNIKIQMKNRRKMVQKKKNWMEENIVFLMKIERNYEF